MTKLIFITVILWVTIYQANLVYSLNFFIYVYFLSFTRKCVIRASNSIVKHHIDKKKNLKHKN